MLFYHAPQKNNGTRGRPVPFRDSENYCWSSSTRSPMCTGSSEYTIIPVAVVGVVPMITISPTARRGISDVRISGPFVFARKVGLIEGCLACVGSNAGALKESESTE